MCSGSIVKPIVYFAVRAIRPADNACWRMVVCATKHPRGLIVSTGEDTPKGQSLRARLLILEIGKGDLGAQPPQINTALTKCQQDAASGLYAQSMAGFITWLAPQYKEIQAALRQEQVEIRHSLAASDQHARTSGIAASLAIGLRYLLKFACHANAISEAEAKTLWTRGLRAIQEAIADQATSIFDAEPANHFLRLISAVLGSGRGHLANKDGKEPTDAGSWGWRQTENGSNASSCWQPQGKRIGWVDGDLVYLEFESAVAQAQDLAREQGDHVAITSQTLAKRLHQKNLLAATEVSGNKTRLKVRRILEGQRRDVICLKEESLFPSESAPSAPINHNSKENCDTTWRTSPGKDGQAEAECANWRTNPDADDAPEHEVTNESR